MNRLRSPQRLLARLVPCAALALCANTNAVAQSSGVSANVHQQREAVMKSEKIMAAAQKRNGMLAQYLYMRDAYANDNDPTFRVIFNQYLSWYQTWVGDYVGARDSFSIIQAKARDDEPSPLEEGAYHAEPAMEAIERLAKDRQAVFFNENHSYPLTRTLTVQMLERLRALGYDTFAAETLYSADMDDLAKRGYATSASGFYTEEPIYAEMIHAALKLGYRVVAYEAESNVTGDEREAEQARNLKHRVFDKNSKARLVVNAGYAHIQERGVYLGGSSMAQHFKRMTGIDPLTIEQTMMIPHAKLSNDHPYFRAIMAAQKPDQPIVYVDAEGTPWSLKGKDYDLSVIFPEETRNNGRPTWLSLGGLRQPFNVTGRLCDDRYPCMVEARYAGEPDSAIPADRAVLDFKSDKVALDEKLRLSSDPIPKVDLWLRPGRYTLLARSVDNQARFRQTIEVGGKDTQP